MSFSSDLKRFTAKTEKNAEKVFRGTFLAMAASIVKRSPVGNPDLWTAWDKRTGRYLPYEAVYDVPSGYVGGRFRGNWQTDVNKPAIGEVNTVDATGLSTLLNARLVSTSANIGDSLYFINNLPYAIPLENGWSSQSPHGMVKRTVTEFKREIKKQVRALK